MQNFKNDQWPVASSEGLEGEIATIATCNGKAPKRQPRKGKPPRGSLEEGYRRHILDRSTNFGIEDCKALALLKEPYAPLQVFPDQIHVMPLIHFREPDT
ncbi:uncharacterized protein PHALS_10998 [Plasmopara halstedii]|uniref:Uncharacterized protein n=1 Tax=Plasmopara halstedii TaxID=4781 RepID=A0A0P1AJ59_PLAHL|nr:uncharacterized protein PHALS_10998 [Plasmopara halstedii]CEG40818.1 hypothetical protein PHALS_10998 [Plasmopara halstedii]|eukprot:XP_024577187.1 hypothetical protein PHALS_10998 [Plasmopara halstedii]